MIKQIWTIRSHKKLFTGLSFGIAGFMFFYSFVTLLVLESTVPWRIGLWGAAESSVSKYWLLFIPVLSLVCCILLYFLSKRATIPFYHARHSFSDREMDAYQYFCIGESFLLSLLFAFAQLDKLNTAKNIAGFSVILPVLILLAMVVFAIWSIHKIRHPLP